MDITADILAMLAAFSLKTHFVAKAEVYARAGRVLYPDDHRFIELLGYALLLDGNADGAAFVINEVHRKTRNIAYLKTCLAMQRDAPVVERQNALRAYLQME